MEYPELVAIQSELEQARMAQQSGNIGKARVRARRAAGRAICAWYERRLEIGWRGDALKQLHHLRSDGLAPEPVREAARRLMTKVDFDHRLPFDDDPLEDARAIIEFVRQGAG